MTTIARFEDLEAWQKARVLARDLYVLSGTGDFARDRILRDQMRRAAVSVLSNIAEGFERRGNAELVQFLSVARGSVGELRAQLFVASDCGYLDSTQFAKLYAMAEEISAKLGALIAYLRRSGMKGVKFKV